MNCYSPSFLGSTERSVFLNSGWQSPRDRLLDTQDDENVQENEDVPSSHCGENSPNRSQVYSPRRTHNHPRDPESVSSRNPEDILALMHDPFTTISNHRKRKAHSEVY